MSSTTPVRSPWFPRAPFWCAIAFASVTLSSSATIPSQETSSGQRVPGLQVLATDHLSLSNHFGVPNSSLVSSAGDFVFVGTGGTGIFLRRPGADAPVRIWQMGDPVPELAGSQTYNLVSYRIDAAGAVVFAVEVGDASADTTRALLLFDGTSVRTLVLGSDIAPDSGGARYERGITVVELTDTGDVYFTATLVPTGQALPTLFRKPAGGSVQRLVGAGDTAPDTNGGTFASLTVAGVTPGGEVLFLSSIDGGTGGSGYFLLTSDGLQKVASMGDTLDGVAIASVAGGTINAAGQVAHLANNGTSLWRYTVADGHTKVIGPGTAVPAPASGTFSTVSSVQLDEAGHLAFQANITGAGAGSSGVFRSRPGVGVVDVVAYRTQSAPGSGGTYNGFSALGTHAGGTLSFRAALTGSSSLSGLFQSRVGESVEAVVLDGQAWSGGGTLVLQPAAPQALPSGALRFQALITNGSINYAELLWTPGAQATITVLLSSTDLLPAGARVASRNLFFQSQGDTVPFVARRAGGRTSIVAHFLAEGTTRTLVTEGDVLPGTGGGIVQSLGSNNNVVASGADGTVAILVTVGGGTINGSGLFAFVPGQGLQKVAVVGELDSTGAAITAVNFSPLQRESQISASGQMLFSSGNVVLLGTPGATPVRIAAVGTVTEGGGTITGSMTPLAVNAIGQVLFRANSRVGLEPVQGVPRYFIGGVGTTPVSILTVGAAAPGGGVLTAISATPAFNASGHTAFKAVLDGSSTSGIFLVSPTGEITTVARDGGDAPSGHVFSMTGSHPDVLLNDDGDVVFRSNLTGGVADSGYFVRRGLVGPVQTLVLQGQPAPGTSGTFGTFAPSLNNILGEFFQLASTGDVSVRGTVDGEPESQRGFWHIAPDLTRTPIAIRGFSRPGLSDALVIELSNMATRLSGGRFALWMRVAGGAFLEGLALFVPAPTVTAPVPQSVVAGAPATFAVTATSERALTYQWQMSGDGGTTFTDVPDGAPFAGATSSTLVVSPTSSEMDQSRFRCVVIDGPSVTTSDSATLTVQPAPTIVIATPTADTTYAVDAFVTASYTCTDAFGTLASCAGPVASGAPLDTSSPGLFEFTVTATNTWGGASSHTVWYTVEPAPEDPAHGLDVLSITMETRWWPSSPVPTSPVDAIAIYHALPVGVSGYAPGPAGLTMFSGINNASVFGGVNFSIGSYYRLVVSAPLAGPLTIRSGTDSHRGAVLQVNGEVLEFRNTDIYDPTFFDPDQYLFGTVDVTAGTNVIEIYGFDNCCDGPARAEYSYLGAPFTVFEAPTNDVPVASLTGPSPVSGNTTQTYEFTVTDDGTSFVVVDASCGVRGDRVGPLTLTPEGGSFECAFHTQGLSQVTVQVDDDRGARSSIAVVAVSVINNAPTFTAPANITAEATGAAGAVVTYTAMGADVEDGPIAAVCSVVSGSTFALGATTVECTVTDTAGASASGAFTVTVVDTTVPTIVYSGNAGTYQVSDTINITCAATDAVGVVSTTCIDIVGPATSLEVGVNTVTSTATDAAGNTGTASTTFTVVVTSEGLQDLITEIVGESAPQLVNAVQSIASAPNANAKTGRVTSFKNQVNAQLKSGKITTEQAALLNSLVDEMQ
jgi:hypothetical protein